MALITNISFDHQALLGDTLVFYTPLTPPTIYSVVPAVIGQTQTEIAAVFEESARRLTPPLLIADQH